jgi:hypothetical protein
MNNIVYIPNGPKNLSVLFPLIDWSLVSSYFVELLEDTTNLTLASSTLNKFGCCCNDDTVRIYFCNYLGTYDAVNFLRPNITHETKFTEFEKGLPNVLQKTDTGTERFNITSNDILSCTTNCYNEEQMLWLQELADSPKAFMQWSGIQGQGDNYIPVVIQSTKFAKKKSQNDFRYEFTVEFKLSNEYLILRN